MVYNYRFRLNIFGEILTCKMIFMVTKNTKHAHIFCELNFAQNMLHQKVSATGRIPRSKKFTNPLCKKIAQFNPTLSTNCTK